MKKKLMKKKIKNENISTQFSYEKKIMYNQTKY